MKMNKVAWGIFIIVVIALVAMVGQDSGLYFVAGGADYTVKSLDKTFYNANVGDSITVSGKAYIHNTGTTTQSYVIEVSSSGGDTQIHKKTVPVGYNFIYTFSGTHRVDSIGAHEVRLLRCVTTDCSFTSHAVGASTLSFSVSGSGGTTTPDPKPDTSSDTISPTVSITTPSDGDVVTSNKIKISGKASDNVGIDVVKVKIGSLGTYYEASGTTSWTIDATLAEGRNTIHARAHDAAGNTERDFIVVSYVPPTTPDEPPVDDTTPPADDKLAETDDSTVIIFGGIIVALFLALALVVVQRRK